MEEKKVSKLAQSVIDSINNKVPTSVLTQVVNDWKNDFSELKRYRSSQKLLKRVGPVAIGIELEKYLSDKYRPRVILYNLIDNSSKLISVVDQIIKDKEGLDISVKYLQHSDQYVKVCELLKQQSRISLFGNPSIEGIIKGIIAYAENDSIGNCFWSCQAVMQLSRLLEDQQKKDEYFEKGLDLAKKKIPVQLLEMQTKGAEKWITVIKNLNAEKIKALVEESVRKHKL